MKTSPMVKQSPSLFTQLLAGLLFSFFLRGLLEILVAAWSNRQEWPTGLSSLDQTGSTTLGSKVCRKCHHNIDAHTDKGHCTWCGCWLWNR